MMKIGFTGTRNGMTLPQADAVHRLLTGGDVREAHHGDCIGADADFHAIVRKSVGGAAIVIHPPEKNDVRAFCGKSQDVHRAATNYFARNRNIVDETDLLIGCPPTMAELPSGGTWYTLRYARKHGKPLIVVWPDGTLTRENDA